MNTQLIIIVSLTAFFAVGFIAASFLFIITKQKLNQLKELFTEEQKQNQLLINSMNEQKDRLDLFKEKAVKEEALKNSLEKQIAENKNNEETFKRNIESQFKIIAQNILERKSEQFKNTHLEELQKVIHPFKSEVKDLQERVNQVHDAENKQRASLETTIENLITISSEMKMEANKLSTAIISDNKQQGNWGEGVLERILQSAGLKVNIHYKTQKHISNESSAAVRPDIIVYLPDDKKVIIDSKVSIKHYYQSLSTEDENERKKLLKEHYYSIAKHIKELSNKHYPKYITGSLNYVLMFVPFESALTVAMQEDQELYSKAVKQNILLITPSTLIVSLNVIQSLWQSENQKKNIERIINQGNRIYEKARLFIDDIEEIGKSLNRVDTKYQSAKSRLYQGKGNLISLSENMRKMGLSVNKKIPQSLQENIQPLNSKNDEIPIKEKEKSSVSKLTFDN